MEASITKQAREKAAAAEVEAIALSEEEIEAAKQAAKERSERALDHIAEIWMEMAATEAFGLLVDELERQAVSHRRVLLDQAFESGLEISQRDVDYDRGLTDGLRRIRVVIDTARRRLEKKDGKTSEPETTEEEVKYW